MIIIRPIQHIQHLTNWKAKTVHKELFSKF